MWSTYNNTVKRIKRKAEEDKIYLPRKRWSIVDKETSEEEKGIAIDVPKKKKFNPKSRKLLKDPLALYKASLIVDRVHHTGIKRLKEPSTWSVLPKSETVTIEIPLTRYKGYGFEDTVVQELGHVAWYKVYCEVDKKLFDEKETPVPEHIYVKQVLKKLEHHPRWKPQNRLWDDDWIGTIEVPGTIFCTEQDTIKNLKYFKNPRYTPEIVHTKDIAHTERDNIGCSIFRRHQPPNWTSFRRAEDEEEDLIWNGLENRNQWVYQSLYYIWAGEETITEDYRERVYWTGPARHFKSDNYFKCKYEPYCHEVVEVEDFEEEEAEDIELFDVEQDGRL